jgi:hypothetical protein
MRVPGGRASQSGRLKAMESIAAMVRFAPDKIKLECLWADRKPSREF